MTVYVYDTEFLEDGSTINLISIGIVCEDGREYYAVNSDADWDRIRKDDWLMDNVVRHLPTHSTGQVEKHNGFDLKGWSWGGIHMRDVRVKPKWVIANEVREFLLASITPAHCGFDGNGDYPEFGFPELWSYYGAYDHVALAQLWGKMISLPKGIPMWTRDLMEFSKQDGFLFPPQPTDQHDALADARWGMKVYREARGL